MQGRTLRTGSALILMLPCLLAGCSVKVGKGNNGEDKDVDVHLPIGSVHVHQSTPSSEDMGLPAYPGALIVKEKDNHSADVHVGFGDWQMTLRVAEYQTGDAQTKVTSFYHGPLARYGDVLECRGGHAVGLTTVTHEGLSCDDKPGDIKGIHLADDEGGLSLRAGSKRHQHIVAIQKGEGSGTRFTLLRLDLPAGHEDKDKEE